MADEVSPLLAEATWEEITNELGRRFPTFVIGIVTDLGKINEAMRYRLYGSAVAGIGLAEWIRAEILKGILNST